MTTSTNGISISTMVNQASITIPLASRCGLQSSAQKGIPQNELVDYFGVEIL